MCWRSSRYCTVHWRWVHTAVEACSSPAGVRTRIAGCLPNLNTRPVFDLISVGLTSSATVWALDSSLRGGIRNRLTGYSAETTKAPTLVPRRQLRSDRRSSGSRDNVPWDRPPSLWRRRSAASLVSAPHPPAPPPGDGARVVPGAGAAEVLGTREVFVGGSSRSAERLDRVANAPTGGG